MPVRQLRHRAGTEERIVTKMTWPRLIGLIAKTIAGMVLHKERQDLLRQLHAEQLRAAALTTKIERLIGELERLRARQEVPL